jgi:hypothetical protein
MRLWLRYTADDLGDLGFDVHYGYGRVNARKAVELSLPDHDLYIAIWEKPIYLEPGNLGIINTTVSNFGTSDESNVIVQLLVNGSVVDSALIEFLASGASTTVSCSWKPMLRGVYNVTAYILPVVDESNTENNVVWARISVGYPLKAVVLRSGGSFGTEFWDILNGNWPGFGSTIIEIDCTSLTKYDITYDDLVATGADVLIISYALYWAYTDQEIQAIMRYVYEGHGLIVTSSTFNRWVPNNNKLARLLGLNETTTWCYYRTYSERLGLKAPTHPLFAKIPDPYYVGGMSTAVPLDLKWGPEELMGGAYVALGGYKESAIVVYNGLVYISPHVEFSPRKNDLQLLYNAITWSSYEHPEHELVTFLEAPTHVHPEASTALEATVFNGGLSNESDVELKLLIDGVTVDFAVIPELENSSFYTINYSWTPAVVGAYNVTVWTTSVLGDDNALNNQATTRVVATYPLINPVEGQWANYTGYSFDENREVTGTIEENFTYARYVSPYEINITEHSKDLDVDRTYFLVVNTLNRWIEKSTTGYIGWYSFWIETNLTIGSTVKRHQLPFESCELLTSTVIDSEFIEVGTRLIECWRLNCTKEIVYPGYPYYSTGKLQWDLWYDKSSGLLVEKEYAQFRNKTLLHGSKIKLVATNIPVGYEHDLAVTLNAPSTVRLSALGDKLVVNITVFNYGLSNETNVELQLLINGTIESTWTFPLESGKKHTTSYLWSPPSFADFNVTAYVTPVPDENIVTNNVATGHVSTYSLGDANYDRNVNIFDGVIIGTAWGSRPGDPHWDPRADLKKDGVIDLYDIVLWGEHFGETA